MMKTLQPGEMVQMNFKLEVPVMEKRHRRDVKRRAEILWDRMQREKKNNLASSDNP
jgi:hypothetical protein